MARNSLCIIDEYTERKDLTRLQKWRLRHPEQVAMAREYTRIYLMDNPDHVSIWRKDNLERYRAQGKRSSKIQRLKRYNLTESEYHDLLTQQNNVCAICKNDKKHKNDWHVDHCHKTGKVRGVLCHHCNNALGQAKESIERLYLMIEYLKRHNGE